MFDATGTDRRHQDLIAAARLQFERAVSGGFAAGGSSNVNFLRDTAGLRNRPTLPGYDLLRELDRGGQGVVYQAIQKSTGRMVAVKVLRGGSLVDGTERLRFEREVSILAQLNHPNIIGILDRGDAAGIHYLVMDYVDGCPLDRYAREHGLALRQRMILFAEVCDAVTSAHLRGVIHRDLKPGNILVDATGKPHILDFGLAKLSDTKKDSEIGATQTGAFVGSLPWVSPEQAGGMHDEVDMRSDVYSLGVVLYQLLTDRLPYSTVGNLEKVLVAIRTAEPTRPRTISSEIDDDLETIVLKCLPKEPSRRYQSVGELARDVRHYLRHEPIEARRDSVGYLFRKALQRNRGAVSVAGAFIALLIGATVLSLGLWRQTVIQRDDAIASVKRESAARDRADAEAAKATQIAQFAQSMLSGIDPATAGDMDKRLIRLVLDGAANRVETELSEQPEVQAAVRHTIGMSYQAIGEMSEAKSQLEKAVEIRRQVLGDEHADTLEAMNNLAMFHDQAAHYADAERLCLKVVEVRRRILGEAHRLTLLSKSNLAEIWSAQGRFDDAEQEHRRLLEQRTRLLGSEDPHTLTTMNNLANVLQNLQKFDESEQLFLQTIEIENRVKGPLHPHTLRTMGNLALLYQESGRMEDALALHRKVLEMRLRVFGDGHPDLFESQINLAIVLRAMGQVDEAEAILRRTLDAERRVLGNKHPLVGGTIILLSSILARRGEAAEAEEMARETVAIYEASLGPDHFKTITARISVGVCLMLQSRFHESEKILLDGYAFIQGRQDVSADWQESSIHYLIRLYDAWDASEPNTGMAEKSAEWRTKLIERKAATQPADAARGAVDEVLK